MTPETPGVRGQTLAGDATAARRWRMSIYAVFALSGIGLSSWTARLPAVRDDLAESTGTMGFLLFGLSIGSILGLMGAHRLLHRWGARTTASTSLLVSALGLVAIGLGSSVAHSNLLVTAGLAAFGLGTGICNVVMNVEGAAAERAKGTSIMPLFHASYSLGAVVGAALGSVAAAMQIDVAVHLAALAAITVVVTFSATRYFRPRDRTLTDEVPSGLAVGQRSAWLEPRTLLIGLLVLTTSFAAGAAGDWLALAMVDGHGASETVAAITYAFYVAAVACGRLGGVVTLNRFGRVTVLRASAVLAALGIALVVFVGTPVIAIVGALLWGLGTSLGFPVAMSAAADDRLRGPARISVVATIGYGAFLIGPPVIGVLGEHVGLLTALIVALALVIVSGIVAPVTREREQS